MSEVTPEQVLASVREITDEELATLLAGLPGDILKAHRMFAANMTARLAGNPTIHSPEFGEAEFRMAYTILSLAKELDLWRSGERQHDRVRGLESDLDDAQARTDYLQSELDVARYRIDELAEELRNRTEYE